MILKNKSFLLSSSILLIFGLILLTQFKFEINPDGVSYLNIAKLYLQGNFIQAVNGYWNPLYSWLLAPLLLLKIEPIILAKTLNMILSVFILFLLDKICRLFKIPNQVISLITILAVPSLLYYSLLITPDVLFTTLVLFYFYTFLKLERTKISSGIILGVIGGLLFYSRSYGFYFF